MPGATIFDLDGTLVDSNDAHARAWLAAFADEGIVAPDGAGAYESSVTSTGANAQFHEGW